MTGNMKNLAMSQWNKPQSGKRKEITRRAKLLKLEICTLGAIAVKSKYLKRLN